MTLTVSTVLLVLALVCFVLATFGVRGPVGGWTPVGLAFLTGFFLAGI